MKFELASGGYVVLDVGDGGGNISGPRPTIVLTLRVAPRVGLEPGCVAVALDEGNAEALEHALIAARLQVQTRAAGR